MEKMSVIFKDIFNDKKKRIVFIDGVILLILLFILFIVFNRDGSVFVGVDNPDGVKIINKYEELNDIETDDGRRYPKVDISSNNKFVYTNINEILNVFNNDDSAVIYFSYPSCLYCRTAIQVLHDTAKDMEIDKIYYMDVENRVDGYDKLLDILGDKFVNNENNTREIFSPLVIFVANGDIVSYRKGTLFSQETPYIALDQSQIDGLSEIYRYGIMDVINAKS